MAYAKINSVTNDNMAKVNSAAKATLGKIGDIDAPASGANAPVTDGLIGYFRADEGITTDTSAGTTTVSQWDNVASDKGGESGQTWNLTQGTKGNQPVYDGAASTVYFGGADYLGGLSGKMPYDSDWSIVFIADGSNRNVFAVFAGGANVSSYIRFHTYNYIVGPRFNNNVQWGAASGTGDTDIFAGDYNVLGTTFDAAQAETNYDNYGLITNQYLLTAGNDCDHSNCVGAEGNDNYSAPNDVDFLNIGVYTGGTLGAQFYAREVMVFNKQLNQTEVTAIYNYADSIVTLNEFTL
jgi:hypothetical protein